MQISTLLQHGNDVVVNIDNTFLEELFTKGNAESHTIAGTPVEVSASSVNLETEEDSGGSSNSISIHLEAYLKKIRILCLKSDTQIFLNVYRSGFWTSNYNFFY